MSSLVIGRSACTRLPCSISISLSSQLPRHATLSALDSYTLLYILYLDTLWTDMQASQTTTDMQRRRSKSMSAAGSTTDTNFKRMSTESSNTLARHHSRFDFEILPATPNLDPFAGPSKPPSTGFDFEGFAVPGISPPPRSPPTIVLAPLTEDQEQRSFELPWTEFDAYDPHDDTVDEMYAEALRASSKTDHNSNAGSVRTPGSSAMSSTDTRTDSRLGSRSPKNPLKGVASKLSRLTSRRRRE
ncbi:hypothetical protein ANO11243_014330 [Dothideomycetidae sp. 11243]|nr:hypothetical protein ANO11243_014330 [fungal sp. No.11243]